MNPNYIYYCNMDRVEELNHRLLDRNVPDNSMKPNFSIRPQSTKLSIFPIIDFKQKPTERLYYYKNNTPAETFNPGSNLGQYSAYASVINSESILQNRIYANQNCEQANYIPSSNSDLYNNHIPVSTNASKQPFPHLFETPHLETTLATIIPQCNKSIHNFTRQQRISLCGEN